jgi:hypothetical protein
MNFLEFLKNNDSHLQVWDGTHFCLADKIPGGVHAIGLRTTVCIAKF